MAEKIECDRCGAQAEGRIIATADVRMGNANGDAQTGKSPSVKDWAFIRSPRLEGKTWPSNATLICPDCVLAHIDFLKPLPAPPIAKR